jgi:hypothetical protein
MPIALYLLSLLPLAMLLAQLAAEEGARHCEANDMAPKPDPAPTKTLLPSPVAIGTNRTNSARSKEAERKAHWRAANLEHYRKYQRELMRRRRAAEAQERRTAAAAS